MSAGNFPLDLSSGAPSFEDLIKQAEQFDIPLDLLENINNYVMYLALQGQIGQQQLGMAQNQLGFAQVGQQQNELDFKQQYELPVRQAESDARKAEIDYRIQHELPFRIEELANSRLLAELNLQLQQERAQNERLTNAEQLQQLRERGTYDAKIAALGLQNALLNLTNNREAAAQGTGRRGGGQYTPRQVDTYGGIRY